MAPKVLKCFSGHFLLHRLGREGRGVFLFSKKQNQEHFFFELGMIIVKSCVCSRLYDYFIGHYSSQAIKLDSENLCTSIIFDFIANA